MQNMKNKTWEPAQYFRDISPSAENPIQDMESNPMDADDQPGPSSGGADILEGYAPKNVSLLNFSKLRDNHVVLLRPKKKSSSEENRQLVETALTCRNLAARINQISKISRGGLIIEAPSLTDLEALEAEISYVPSLGEHFDVSKPKTRRPKVIILGIPNDIDKDRLSKGLTAKNHYARLRIFLM
ncbi:hypothetical protein AVEN_57919-1 [Araneus ventricosus]|uniref:Uncharacterized protein n=1 Tax=Araneus ventricosus TaxID=182803 RepID=A0A4Y2KGG7_ARAVE|nr:hypothetical protein AVEN_57919-1 [Araneus ventricosus]